MGLGLRWIRCGWRLFLRNPWQLGGMGLCGSVLVVVLTQVPLLGGPLLGLFAPAAVAAFYVAIQEISKQKIKLPAALRLYAVKQSPREFLSVARDERQLMQVSVMGLYGMVVVVLTDIIAWLIAGTALVSPLANLSFGALVAVAIANILRFAVHLTLAASLVFTLPLALLQNQALVTAMIDSMKRASHHAIALLAIVLLSLVPLLLGALTSFYSTSLGYLVGLVAGVFALPVTMCSLYCGYRTIFAVANSPAPAPPPLRGLKDIA